MNDPRTDPGISAQHRRENAEPEERANPVPWPVLLGVGAVFAACIVYIAYASVDTPSDWGDGRTQAELAGEPKAAGPAAVDGAAIYASLCVACHQATGAGLPGVFPPLAGSEWVNGKEGTAAAIVLHGVSGPLTVKGQTFNGAMPAFQAQLSDAQIAALLTHLRSHWGNASPPVTAQTVGQVREALKARTGPFAGDQELAALP